MTIAARAKKLSVLRVCARVAVALCLVAFGFGDAVERSLASHSGLDATLSYAVAAGQPGDHSLGHSGLHVDDQSNDADGGGQMVGHGCHGCAALPQPVLQVAVTTDVRGSALAWASAPSTAGREPLVDLPPPRA